MTDQFIIRPKNKEHELPPPYPPESGDMTLILRHGGKFTTKYDNYIGGEKVILDYFNVYLDCNYATLNLFLEHMGTVASFERYYADLGNGYRLLSDDESLIEWGKVCLPTSMMKLCVEIKKWCGEDGQEGKGECVQEGEGADQNLDVDRLDDDVFVDSDYDFEDEESDDDMIWDGYVHAMAIVEGNAEDAHVSDEDTGEEDVVWASDGFDEYRVSDEEGLADDLKSFNPDLVYNPSFEFGMVFESKNLFKKAVQSHAIMTKRSLKFVKNDRIRVHAKCRDEECDWKIHLLKRDNEETFQIRTYNPTHTCPPQFKVKNVTGRWLGEKYVFNFHNDSKRKVKGWRKDTSTALKVDISKQKAYRAKKRALEIIQGLPEDQYNKLWDYAQELRNTNLNSTIVLLTEKRDGEERFSRFYVCFDAVKRGFKRGCRPFIGLDGCFLKGPHGGVLLSAVGVDPSNRIYPIAWAVVSSENAETWEWFMILLKNDLNIQDPERYTFMSDKQKGLIQAMVLVFPKAEHRFCVRHMHNNFKKSGGV